MKYLKYVTLGFVVFWVIEILTIKVGETLGTGPYGLDLVVYAISALCSVITICTLIIVDEIRQLQLRRIAET